MFQRKRKSGVYLHNYTRFKAVTKIIFILIISSVIAADSKCKLTSKEAENCDQATSKTNDGDYDNEFKIHYSETNTKLIPHSSNHHNKLEFKQIKNSIYKYINDMINTRTSEILLNSMNQLPTPGQRELVIDPEVVERTNSIPDERKDMMALEELIDYIDSSDSSLANGRDIGSSEGRLFFFKGNSNHTNFFTL